MLQTITMEDEFESQKSPLDDDDNLFRYRFLYRDSFGGLSFPGNRRFLDTFSKAWIQGAQL